MTRPLKSLTLLKSEYLGLDPKFRIQHQLRKQIFLIISTFVNLKRSSVQFLIYCTKLVFQKLGSEQNYSGSATLLIL
jgi:hypothetical protein